MFFKEHSGEFAWGTITYEEEAGIRKAVELASGHEGPIVEIGCLFGHTTNLIASCKSQDKQLFAVDNFSWNPFGMTSEAHRLYTERTISYIAKHCNTVLFVGGANDFYSAHRELTPSLVFIDAEHTYDAIKRDIAWASKANCKIICGHDYSDSHPGVKRAVDENFSGRFELVGTVWIVVNDSSSEVKDDLAQTA